MEKKGWDLGYCTAPRCRTPVKSGDGIQFVDEEGNTQRYCASCYQKREREQDIKRAEAPLDKMLLPEAVHKGKVWEIGGSKYKFVRLLNKNSKNSDLITAEGEKVARLPSGKLWLIGLFARAK